jgi:hypothetical protein
VTVAIKERLHLRVGNMVFEFLCYLLLMTVDFKSFGQHVFFGYMSNIYFFENNFKYQLNKLSNVSVMMGVTRRGVLLN